MLKVLKLHNKMRILKRKVKPLENLAPVHMYAVEILIGACIELYDKFAREAHQDYENMEFQETGGVSRQDAFRLLFAAAVHCTAFWGRVDGQSIVRR